MPVPRYAVLRRDENNVCDDPNFQESEDTIRVHGKVFHKPFVEKPLSAEDHNVYIYFPSHAGGGCQQLFRKIGSLSSRYCDQSQVRNTGSYIYENFTPTEGTDVKVSFLPFCCLCTCATFPKNVCNAESKLPEYLMLSINITSIIIHEQGIKES